MIKKPYISRVRALKGLGKYRFGLEISLDNPTSQGIWIDFIELKGNKTSYASHRLVGKEPYLREKNYSIQIKLTTQILKPEDNMDEKILIEGDIIEVSEKNWAYIASGEYHRKVMGSGSIINFNIVFPILEYIQPKARTIVRFLFSTPFTKLISHLDSGHSGGVTASGEKVECYISAITNKDLIIEKKIDRYFYDFLEHSLSKPFSFDISTLDLNSLLDLRNQFDSLFEIDELEVIFRDFNFEYDRLMVETKNEKIRDFLTFIRTSPDLISKLSQHPLVIKNIDKKNHKSKWKILFLAADPTNLSRLRLDQEYREINEQLNLARNRGRFKLEIPQLSIRAKDISGAILNNLPQIVHFSGHGTTDGSLCFENEFGQVKYVKPEALESLFAQFKNKILCVVLNACYSEEQARLIAKHIDYVIGMNKAIGDNAAIAFSIGFYQALGAGRTIEKAFSLGCVQIGLQGIPEESTPVLIKRQ
jgi:hypothetical protein